MPELRETRPEPGVVELTLCRPERKNALTRKLVAELDDAIRTIQHDLGVRAIVLRGDGGTFCAGADYRIFADMPDMDGAERRQMTEEFIGLTNTIATARVPTVAAVQGAAVGGGAELVLACDLVVAAQDAHIRWIFVAHGLLPDMGGTKRLAQRVGIGRARDLMLTGRPVDGQIAEAWGLADRVTASDNVVGAARQLAAELAQHPPSAVRLIRRQLNQALDMDGASAQLGEVLASYVTSGSADHRAKAAAMPNASRPAHEEATRHA